ncbi:MAG: permease-like cell division protein FtsX [Symbiobacteriia bacterium]
MRLSTWRYAFRDLGTSLKRNRTTVVTSVTTVSIALLLLAVFLVVAINLDAMATGLENQVQVTAWLDSNLKPDDINNLTEQIKAFPGVAQVTFVNQTDAMARLAQRLGDQQALEYAGTDFLRPSFEIKTNQPATDVMPVAQAVTGLAGVQNVDYKRDMVQRLFRITQALRVFSLLLVLALAIATIFIISNTIRLAVFARRREITIMKLVGATDTYIRRPFVLEGIFFGIVGGGVAALVIGWAYAMFLRFITANLPFLAVVPSQPLLSNLTLTLLGLGVALGAVGSAVSIRRFLRV